MDLYTSSLLEISSSQHKDFFSQYLYPWELLTNLHLYLTKHCTFGIHCKIPQSCHLEKPELIYIDESAVIEPQSFIEGPAWIGPHCQIRQGAYIRGDVLACSHAVIGHCTEVKNAIFLNHAKAAHFAYVGDSILGNYVNLGAGTRLANLRFDQRELAITCQQTVYRTGRKKLGSILSDYCQTGCNTVLNPGTILGPYSFVWPCKNVQGVWPERSKIK